MFSTSREAEREMRAEAPTGMEALEVQEYLAEMRAELQMLKDGSADPPPWLSVAEAVALAENEIARLTEIDAATP